MLQNQNMVYNITKNMKAILIKNELIFPTNFMLIGENWVSNPTDEQLTSEGFKNVTYQEVDEVIEPYAETETQIIVFTQKYVESESTEIV